MSWLSARFGSPLKAYCGCAVPCGGWAPGGWAPGGWAPGGWTPGGAVEAGLPGCAAASCRRAVGNAVLVDDFERVLRVANRLAVFGIALRIIGMRTLRQQHRHHQQRPAGVSIQRQRLPPVINRFPGVVCLLEAVH